MLACAKPLTVVLTRPAGQNALLQQAIEKWGHHAYVMPWLRLSPLLDLEQRIVLWNILCEEWGGDACAIFVSAASVTSTLPDGFEWPNGVWALATGIGTARVLREKGVPDCWIRYPQMQFDSEALWYEHSSCFSAGRPVTIFRGQSGRSWLGDQVAEKGCILRYITVYQRLLNEEASQHLNQAYQDGLRWQAMVLTNSEAVLGMGIRLLEEIWQNVTVFVPHSRIAETVQLYSPKEVILTKGGDEGLMLGLEEWIKAKS